MIVNAFEPGCNKESHNIFVNTTKETWTISWIYTQMMEVSDHRHVDSALSWYILVNNLCPEVTQMRNTANSLDDKS